MFPKGKEVRKEPLEVEKANKLAGYQHRVTGPWKICAQLKLCKGRLLGCLTGVMRQVYCGVKKMSGYPTTVVKQRGECATRKGDSLETPNRAVMKEYIGKGYALKPSPEEADHLGERGGCKRNYWPITIGDAGLTSTYQLCRRDPSGNRKKEPSRRRNCSGS